MRLDARTKLLNPKWYEGMLGSGYEGVREIQKRLTNTMGWSATSGQVRPTRVAPLRPAGAHAGHAGLAGTVHVLCGGASTSRSLTSTCMA